uniref:Uncharacterized protein n=1 Tax=Trichuris muris TaxID=70415 RepID=A0A5S6QC15_TRIMR
MNVKRVEVKGEIGDQDSDIARITRGKRSARDAVDVIAFSKVQSMPVGIFLVSEINRKNHDVPTDGWAVIRKIVEH